MLSRLTPPWRILVLSALALLFGWGLASYGWLLFAGLALAYLMVQLLAHPRLLAMTMLATVALGQIARLSPSGSNDVLILDLLVILLFGVWLVWLLTQKEWRRQLFLSPAHLVWLGFLATGLVVLLANPVGMPKKEILTDGFYLLRLAAYSSLIWIIPQLFQTQAKARQLLDFLVKVGMVVVLIGFLQLYVFPNIGSLSKYGWDPHVGRLVSSFLDPNFLGGYLAILLAVLLARTQGEREGFPFFKVALVLAATVFTYSRSGYLAVMAVVLTYGLLYARRLLIIFLLVVIPVSLSIPRVRSRITGGFSIDTTSQDRIQSWHHAITVVEEFPLLGVGYNSYKQAQQQLGIIGWTDTSRAAGGSDSSLLNIYATTGVPGVLLFCLTVLLVLRNALAKLRSGRKGVQVSVGLALLLVAPALFLHSFFVNAFFYPFILVTLSTLVGIMYLPED